MTRFQEQVLQDVLATIDIGIYQFSRKEILQIVSEADEYDNMKVADYVNLAAQLIEIRRE